MIHEFSDDLSEQRIYANGVELNRFGLDSDGNGNRLQHKESEKVLLGMIHNPVLATDPLAWANFDTKTHLNLDAISRTQEPVLSVYGGTTVRFKQADYPKVWGPNIDTYLFMRALSHEDLEARTSIEIGPGSGMISKWLLEHARIDHHELIDLEPQAVDASRYNIHDGRARYFVGDGIQHLEQRLREHVKYDLIICNPPYIPRPKSIDDNAYEGMRLLAYFITDAHKHLNPGGKIITNISSLSESVARPLLEKSPLQVRELDRMRVPLKVMTVLNNDAWLSYLTENKGLHEERCRGYDYWHTLSITELRKD